MYTPNQYQKFALYFGHMLQQLLEPFGNRAGRDGRGFDPGLYIFEINATNPVMSAVRREIPGEPWCLAVKDSVGNSRNLTWIPSCKLT